MTVLQLPRWLTLYTAPVLAFATIAYLTEDQALILVLNIILAGLTLSAFVTFTPLQYRIAFKQEPLIRGAVIGYGVWWVQLGVLSRIVLTLMWRDMGQPLWLVNSDLTSWNLFACCIGTIGHLVRPNEINANLPRREVIRIGLIVGAGFAVFLGVVSWPEICATWRHQKAVWFRTPGLESAVAGPPPKNYRAAEDVPDDIQRALARPPIVPRRVVPRDTIPLGDVLRNDDGAAGMVHMDTTLSPEDAARVAQSGTAHGDRSRRATLRRLIPRALDDEDRDALGPYEPEKR